MQRARKTRPPEAALPKLAERKLTTAQPLSMLPRLAADLFQRMTDEEKLAFLQLVGPETIEEWLATLELSGPEVDALIERARRDIEAGLESEVPL
ncbi:MAG: hypothetical protein HY303_09390 [Candidatus Wallbacteria bacterium]|nr:hypothetical protein [Candidatus Wallbacteria bacterium]